MFIFSCAGNELFFLFEFTVASIVVFSLIVVCKIVYIINYVWIKKVQGAAHFSLTHCKYKMVYIINQMKVRKNEPIRYKFIFLSYLIRFI